jgi:hypothetical protein
MVAVMPCVAKKYEAQRPEHMMPDGRPLYGCRVDHTGADLDDQMLWYRLHPAA